MNQYTRHILKQMNQTYISNKLHIFPVALKLRICLRQQRYQVTPRLNFQLESIHISLHVMYVIVNFPFDVIQVSTIL